MFPALADFKKEFIDPLDLLISHFTLYFKFCVALPLSKHLSKSFKDFSRYSK